MPTAENLAKMPLGYPILILSSLEKAKEAKINKN